MAFLILAYPFLEIYAFYRFIDAYSFIDALLLIFTSGLLGAVILATQGKSSIQGLQSSLTQGKIPANQILHKAVIMVGAILIMVPGIISDLIGALCILPVSRHVIVAYLKFALLKGISQGRVGVFGSGFTFSSDMRFRRRPAQDMGPFEEKDATVVDVTPIEVTHTDTKDS